MWHYWTGYNKTRCHVTSACWRDGRCAPRTSSSDISKRSFISRTVKVKKDYLLLVLCDQGAQWNKFTKLALTICSSVNGSWESAFIYLYICLFIKCVQKCEQLIKNKTTFKSAVSSTFYRISNFYILIKLFWSDCFLLNAAFCLFLFY